MVGVLVYDTNVPNSIDNRWDFLCPITFSLPRGPGSLMDSLVISNPIAE